MEHEKDRIIAFETRQANFAQEQRALQSIHSRYFADVGRHAIVPQLGTGRMESRMRGLATAMVTETSLWIRLAVAVATKQQLARVNEVQMKSPGRLTDDSKTPIF